METGDILATYSALTVLGWVAMLAFAYGLAIILSFRFSFWKARLFALGFTIVLFLPPLIPGTKWYAAGGFAILALAAIFVKPDAAGD